MNHEISLKEAVAMTEAYRAQKDNVILPSHKGKDILAVCETFGADAVQKVLNQTGCKGMRIYYGMDTEMKVHAIIVGVNDKGEDILPLQNALLKDGEEDEIILEEATRCPTNCPPPSPLNP